MVGRVEPLDSLDFFPTPPWGTRALMEHVLPRIGHPSTRNCTVWEPAAGEGHMSRVLQEYFGQVHASDVHDYGCGHAIGSFVGEGLDIASCPFEPDWIITNPPFRLGEEFIRRAMTMTKVGVAMLARTAFIESAARYPLFSSSRFRAFAPFASRLPMVKGRWDPAAASATSYSWFVWLTQPQPLSRFAELIIIPPSAQNTCWHPEDTKNFAQIAAE